MEFHKAQAAVNRYGEESLYDSEAVSEEESLDDENKSYSANVESDSYDPEWVDEINESGELFYVGSSLPVVQEPSLEDDGLRTSSPDNISNSTQKSTKSKGRLKILTKYNKIKNGDLGPREVPGAEDTASIHSPKVTFQEPQGELKEVYIEVDPKRHNYGRRATMCEVLFGIIPGHFDTGKHYPRNGSCSSSNGLEEDNRIMIHGLIPDGEAMRTDAIKIGDWLRSVNDVDVNFSNIYQILSSITTSSKIKLTLQTLASQYYPEDMKMNSQVYSKTKLAKFITPNGTRDDDEGSALNMPLHIIMYLSVEGVTEQNSGKEDILYQFPEVDNKLTQIRGLFITISHTLADITASRPMSSSLFIEGKLFHIGYVHENSDLLVIGLPEESITLSHMHQLMQDMERLLKFKYHSMHEAFSQNDNKIALNHMFCITLQQLFTNQNGKCSPILRTKFRSFQDSVLAAQSLNLPNMIKMEVHNILSEFESNEFVDLSNDYYEARRNFSILGSCLFYKGYLVVNHLPTEDLLDVFSYMKYHGLISLTSVESISRIIIWKEIHPTRRTNEKCKTEQSLPETTGRWFLMIIGLKQYLLGIVLETGGCALRVEGNPGPDPCFINQAENTLLQLESLQISTACDSQINFEIPVIANVDWFVQSAKGLKETMVIKTWESMPSCNQLPPKQVSSTKKSSAELISILKKKSTTLPNLAGSNTVLCDNESDTSHSMGTSATSSLSDENLPTLNRRERLSQGRTSSSDADSRGSSNSILYKSEKKTRMLPSSSSSLDLNSFYKTLPDPENLPTRLTVGAENILFHYLQFDSGEGVYICPKEARSSSMLNTEVLENFQEACVSIHKVFQNTLDYKKMLKEKDYPRFGVDHIKRCVKEHGILFECSLPTRPNQKRPSPTLTYWVVGRLFLEHHPREVYVCFVDSIPQNIVEMAFKLNFGTS